MFTPPFGDPGGVPRSLVEVVNQRELAVTVVPAGRDGAVKVTRPVKV